MRFIILALFLNSCISVGQQKNNENPVWEPPNNNYKNLKKAYFASGCFWCVEAVFESVKGVYEVYSGYSGGYLKNPTYNTLILIPINDQIVPRKPLIEILQNPDVKKNIGETVSVEDYNLACKKAVMKYTDEWEELTHKIGFWININDPYKTYDS